MHASSLCPVECQIIPDVISSKQFVHIDTELLTKAFRGRDRKRISAELLSDYRKYPPGQVRRIRLKIEKSCRLFLDIFNSVIMNDLAVIFTPRLKMDAKCVNQQ